jgi:hypothetical protein
MLNKRKERKKEKKKRATKRNCHNNIEIKNICGLKS